MSTISSYVTSVRNQIRDNGKINFFPPYDPTTGDQDEEITQYVNAAVEEFSRYIPLRKPYTLNLIQGQTEYTLPTDWIYVDQGALQRALHPRSIPDLLQYQLPWVEVSSPLGSQYNSMDFIWYDDIQQMVVTTAPLSDYSLSIAYYAFHQVDTNGSTIPKRWENAMLLVACERALRAIVTDLSVSKLQKYRMGGRFGIEIDNHNVIDNLLKQADSYRERFKNEVINRPHGGMGPNDVMGGVQGADW
jgi:hypothetical protein